MTKPIPVLGELHGGNMTSAVLEQAITITPCSPFSGRPTGAPRVVLESIPTDIDMADPPIANADIVMAWVGDDPERARAATLLELERPTPRRRLLAALGAVE